jgi:hypothetical protein
MPTRRQIEVLTNANRSLYQELGQRFGNRVEQVDDVTPKDSEEFLNDVYSEVARCKIVDPDDNINAGDAYISIYQDKFSSRKSVFCTGFYSSTAKVIDILVDNAPAEFTPINSTKEMKYDKNGMGYFEEAHWQRIRLNPYETERFFDDNIHFFGLYHDCGRQFSVDISVNFVSRVLVALPYYYAVESPYTQRERLIQARVGQGWFRGQLLERWGKKCAVLGVKEPTLLRASHILPWAKSNDRERLDPENGLLLSAHLDSLFDKHLVTFDDRGAMIVSRKRVSPNTRILLQLEGMTLNGEISTRTREYLRQHRETFEELERK